MKKKKRNNDFSLSFLDIMACGLGGVIIIFLLLDNRPNSRITETDTNNEILIDEIERLSNSNLELSTANQQLELNIANEKNKLSDELIVYDNPKEGLILSRLILLFESIPIELISYLIPYLKRKPVLKVV